MRIYNGFEAFLIAAISVYAIFMFAFPFLIIDKLNTIIRNQMKAISNYDLLM